MKFLEKLGNEQFVIYTRKGEIFQSYDSVVACKLDGKVYINKEFLGYSKITSKYLKRFIKKSPTQVLEEKDFHNFVLNYFF